MNAQMIDNMTIMSVAEVAEYLRVTELAVRRLIAKGSIPSNTQTHDAVDKPKQIDAQEYLHRICRRPAIAVILAIGLAIVALGSFTDALQKIVTAVRSLLSAVF
jgi:hypothetical protein